jgi:hypothetical protein
VGRIQSVAKVRTFIRQNPQLAALAVIVLVLGIGTFIAVLIALATAGSATTNGEPSGVVAAGRLLGSAVSALAVP